MRLNAAHDLVARGRVTRNVLNRYGTTYRLDLFSSKSILDLVPRLVSYR